MDEGDAQSALGQGVDLLQVRENDMPAALASHHQGIGIGEDFGGRPRIGFGYHGFESGPLQLQ